MSDVLFTIIALIVLGSICAIILDHHDHDEHP